MEHEELKCDYDPRIDSSVWYPQQKGNWQRSQWAKILGYCLCIWHCVSNRRYNPQRFSAAAVAAAAEWLQSCPTLHNPIDSSPPGSPIPGILQARRLEWVAIFFFNAWKWKVKVKSLSRVQLLATPWTAAYQALPSMGFSRQEYWSRLPLPSLTALL